MASTTPSPTASPAPTSPPAPPSNSTAAPPPTNSSTAAPPPSLPPPPSSDSPPAPATPSSSPPPSSAIPSSPSPPATPATPSIPATPSSSSSSPGKPSPSSTGTPPPSQSSSSSSVSFGAVVGIAVGVVALLLVMGFFCFCCFRKKKKQQHYGGSGSPPHPIKGDPYGGQYHNWQHNLQPQAEQAVKIASHPSPPPAFGGSLPPHRPAGRYPPPQPPPPPSHDLNFSGGGGSGDLNHSGSDNPYVPPSPGGVRPGGYQSTFTYEELALATDGFSKDNLLGQGGFGYVHKGLLRDGKEVAVKQLKAGSGQGEREFRAEVEIISRVHHRHLVSLVGYCISGGQRLLVYEFVPNNTLEFHLHGKGRPTMDCSTRLKIALGSAKGLAYLHEDCHPKIFHRDIKSANILLDLKFEAKVADFGLAKSSSDNNTHVSTRVMGTFGYMAPEYASSGKLTDKSDVFSFGVMLLELITGRRPFESSDVFADDCLVDWARPLLTRALDDGNYDPLVDPRLARDYNHNEMARLASCAAACVRHSARRRPRMSQVVRALEGDVSLDDLNDGIKPGHSRPYGSQFGSTDYDSGQYNEDIMRHRKMALAMTSQDYASSDYSATASEHSQDLLELGKARKVGGQGD